MIHDGISWSVNTEYGVWQGHGAMRRSGEEEGTTLPAPKQTSAQSCRWW